MIAFWIGLPIGLRLTLLAVLGLAGGALANYVIYPLPTSIHAPFRPGDEPPSRPRNEKPPIACRCSAGWDCGVRPPFTAAAFGFARC